MDLLTNHVVNSWKYEEYIQYEHKLQRKTYTHMYPLEAASSVEILDFWSRLRGSAYYKYQQTLNSSKGSWNFKTRVGSLIQWNRHPTKWSRQVKIMQPIQMHIRCSTTRNRSKLYRSPKIYFYFTSLAAAPNVVPVYVGIPWLQKLREETNSTNL